MSDWAVERARAVFAAGNVGSTERIAAALRQARIEALEEAANEAIRAGNVKLIRWDGTEENLPNQGYRIAESIRALKDK